jgi:hypothetical protein
MEREVVKTTTVATIEVLRMVVPPDYQMQCCGLTGAAGSMPEHTPR